MKSTVLALLVDTAFFFYFSPFLFAGTIDPHLSQTLQQLNPDDEIAVIITLADQVDVTTFKNRKKKQRRAAINRALRDKAGKTQQPLKDFLSRKNARNIQTFWIFNGIAATIRADAVTELAAQPGVQSIQPDGILLAPAPVPAAAATPEWNIAAINAPSLWALGHTGVGVVIASMDTGVDGAHPDLASRWRGGSNSWFDPHGEHAAPYDSSAIGHGTGTMGIMVGGDAGGTSIGVAPGARWIAVKLFDDAGGAQYSDIHAGFQWLLDPDGDPGTDDAPDIVNNSWGFNLNPNECFTEFRTDVQNLKAAGIAVVFSAGNSGPGAATSISPANYQESFAVGSVDSSLAVALTSSRGPSTCDGTFFPEITAPGVNVLTADRTLGGGNPDPYAFANGTSFAAPHVSGAMALLLSALPQLTVTELETVISQYATDLGDPGTDNDYGNGLLDVAAAYNSFTTYSLAVTVTGRGSVTTSPADIECQGNCSVEFIDGTLVILTAAPGPGSRFTGWSGDCSGTDMTCQVTMDQARNVSADFYSFPWYLFFPIPAMTQQK